MFSELKEGGFDGINLGRNLLPTEQKGKPPFLYVFHFLSFSVQSSHFAKQRNNQRSRE